MRILTWHGLGGSCITKHCKCLFQASPFLMLCLIQLCQKWKLHQCSVFVFWTLWEETFIELIFIGWHASVIDFKVTSLATLKLGFYTSPFSRMGTFDLHQKWAMTSVLSLCCFKVKIWKKYSLFFTCINGMLMTFALR